MNKAMLVILTSIFLGTMAHAAGLKLVSGDCQIEGSGEKIQLNRLDPNQYYGMFAEGYSKEKDRVYLDENDMGKVRISIEAGDHASYSLVLLAASGPTHVNTGITLVRADGNPDWLSCDLVVQ